MKIEYRIATSADLPQLADLRWRLRVDDEPIKNRPAYDRFVADFVGICNTEWETSDVVHWIAVDGANAVGVISIILVRKLPSPEKLRDRWGYISTSYVLPEFRNAGVGQELLAAVEEWAQKEDLELLVVWPSERAYPFYERSGFSRHPDPLVLKLRMS
jgi:GNAT superfamily N-acetyltransferase